MVAGMKQRRNIITEEEINMKFVQDLLNWVDEMQVKIFTLPEFQALLLPVSFSNLISFYLYYIHSYP